MRRQCFAVVASVVASAMMPALAQGPSSETVKPFNATSLAGWRTQGAATWRPAGGEIVGSAAAAPGSLVLEKSIGTQISVVDVNGDKRPDVLTAQRKGAYVFLNNISPSRERTTSTR